MNQLYLAAILVLGTIVISGSIDNMVAYGSSSSGGSNRQKNDACYNAGLNDGRTHPYNQTTFSGCGTYGRAYYEGFLSGCISNHGGDYFTCQKMTNARIDGSNGGGNSNGGGGGGSFNGFGGHGRY